MLAKNVARWIGSLFSSDSGWNSQLEAYCRQEGLDPWQLRRDMERAALTPKATHAPKAPLARKVTAKDLCEGEMPSLAGTCLEY